MNDIVQADIFFFISTFAVVAVTAGIVIVLFYVIKILRNVSDVSNKVRKEGGEIVEDIHEFRQKFLFGLFSRRKKKEDK